MGPILRPIMVRSVPGTSACHAEGLEIWPAKDLRVELGHEVICTTGLLISTEQKEEASAPF